MSPMGPVLCSQNLGCFGGICKQLPTSINSPCTDVEFKCPLGMGCQFSKSGQPKCVNYKKVGESCNAHECAPNLYCDFAILKCQNKLGINKDCTNNFDSCLPELDCKPYKKVFQVKARCSKPSVFRGELCTNRCEGEMFCGPENKYLA